jgi:hypothetical protein
MISLLPFKRSLISKHVFYNVKKKILLKGKEVLVWAITLITG